jgi:glycosyltransferase involved in cell wall biosynthesis
MPYVSVVVPTMRVGGLDILFDGLKQQTFKDFELVLSDGLYKYRKDIVAEKAREYGLRVKHVEPYKNPFPKNAFCRYANTGLTYADCEMVLFMTDYTLAPPGCIEVHQDFHRRAPNDGLMCPHVYKALPPVNKEFPNYKKMQIEAYAKDVIDGRLKNMMWSILEKNVNGTTIVLEDDPNFRPDIDLKLRLPAAPNKSSLFHGKNESCALKYALDVNGWNEALDGTHGWQDSEFAGRIQSTSDLSAWVVQPDNGVYIINPRWVFPFAQRSRNIKTNEVLWKQLESEGYPRPNAWSLRNPNSLLQNDQLT